MVASGLCPCELLLLVEITSWLPILSIKVSATTFSELLLTNVWFQEISIPRAYLRMDIGKLGGGRKGGLKDKGLKLNRNFHEVKAMKPLYWGSMDIF